MADAREIENSAEAERRLGRYAAIGIPALSILVAVGLGFVFSLAPAILVLVGGAILGAITLLWASLRTLTGDAPLPADIEAMAIRKGSATELAERKRRVLRALKDLELEHSVGKIDDKDFATLGARFRDEAKQILREMDEQIEPMREEAEKVARKYLEKKGLGPEQAKPQKSEETRDSEETSASDGAQKKPSRVACPKCKTSNEPDAAFCKKCGTALATEPESAPAPEEKEADAPR